MRGSARESAWSCQSSALLAVECSLRRPPPPSAVVFGATCIFLCGVLAPRVRNRDAVAAIYAQRGHASAACRRNGAMTRAEGPAIAPRRGNCGRGKGGGARGPSTTRRVHETHGNLAGHRSKSSISRDERIAPDAQLAALRRGLHRLAGTHVQDFEDATSWPLGPTRE